jgi:hypothetical protein
MKLLETQLERGITMINLFDFTLPILFGPDAMFRLYKVNKWNEHTEDEKKEPRLLGYKYDVAEVSQAIRFTVKVESDNPVVENSDVMSANTPIFVSFEGSHVTFYGAKLFEAKMSVTAKSVSVVKDVKQASLPLPQQRSTKQ